MSERLDGTLRSRFLQGSLEWDRCRTATNNCSQRRFSTLKRCSPKEFDMFRLMRRFCGTWGLLRECQRGLFPRDQRLRRPAPISPRPACRLPLSAPWPCQNLELQFHPVPICRLSRLGLQLLIPKEKQRLLLSCAIGSLLAPDAGIWRPRERTPFLVWAALTRS